MALVHPSITALAGKTISFAGLPVIIGKVAILLRFYQLFWLFLHKVMWNVSSKK